MSDRKLRIGLIVSLILNVFLIGGVAGGLAFWRLNPQAQAVGAPAAGAQPRRALRFAADGLAPEQRAAFLQTLRQARRESLPQVREAQRRRRELVDLIGAAQFDRAAVIAAMDGARSADVAVRTRVETAVIDYAANLSPDDRALFVQGLARSPTLRPPAPRRNPQDRATDMPAPTR